MILILIFRVYKFVLLVINWMRDLKHATSLIYSDSRRDVYQCYTSHVMAATLVLLMGAKLEVEGPM